MNTKPINSTTLFAALLLLLFLDHIFLFLANFPALLAPLQSKPEAAFMKCCNNDFPTHKASIDHQTQVVTLSVCFALYCHELTGNRCQRLV